MNDEGFSILEEDSKQLPPVSPAPAEAPQEESALGSAIRNIVRTGVHGVEEVLGIPGNVANLIASVSRAIPFKAPGSEMAIKALENFPTAETFRKYGTEPIAKRILPEGYLEAKGEGEKFLDEFTSDLATMLIPIKGKIPFKGALKTVMAGNLASFLGKQLGAEEKGQAGLKVAGMLLSGLATPRKVGATGKAITRAEEVASKLYKEAESVIPAGARVETKNLSGYLNELRKKVDIGDYKVPSKAFMRERINTLQDAIRGDSLSVREAWAFKRDMNEWMRNFDTPRGVKKFLPNITHELNSSLKDYGEKNPAFYKSFKEADALHKAVNSSMRIGDIFQANKWKNLLRNMDVGAVALLGGVSYLSPKLAAALGTGIFAKRGLQILASSPQLQKEYLGLIGKSARASAPVLVKEMKKFDKKFKAASEKVSEEPRGEGFSIIE